LGWVGFVLANDPERCFLPSSRTIVTDVPNRISRWPTGTGTTRAGQRRRQPRPWRFFR
jgi:hypothetical protein